MCIVCANNSLEVDFVLWVILLFFPLTTLSEAILACSPKSDLKLK